MYIFEIQKKMVCSLYSYKMFYLCYILFILLYVYFNYKI